MNIQNFDLETTYGSMIVKVIKPYKRIVTGTQNYACAVLPSGKVHLLPWETAYLDIVDGEEFSVFLNCEDRDSYETLDMRA